MQKLFPILAGLVLSLAFATASHAVPLQSSTSVDVRASASQQSDLGVADAAPRTGLVKTSTAANSRSRPGDAPLGRSAGQPADAEAAVIEDPADLDLDLLALLAGFVLVVAIALRRSHR